MGRRNAVLGALAVALAAAVAVRAVVLVPTQLSAIESAAWSVVESDTYAVTDAHGVKHTLALQRAESGLMASLLSSAGAAYAVQLSVTGGAAYRLAEDTTPDLSADDHALLRGLLLQAVAVAQQTAPESRDAFVNAFFDSVNAMRRGYGATLRQLGRWVERAGASASATGERPGIMPIPIPPEVMAADTAAKTLPSGPTEPFVRAGESTVDHIRADLAQAAAGLERAVKAAVTEGAAAAVKSLKAPPRGPQAAAAVQPAAPLKAVGTVDGHVQTVWYGTNRVAVGEDEYGAAFSNTVRYGQVQVLVPHAHEAGSTGSSWVWRTWTGIDDRLRPTYFNELTNTTFWARLRASVAADGVQSALVFIHGYCNTFRDAAIRTAQLAFDLNFPGVSAFYSWPSRGDATGYAADEQNVARSVALVSEWLHDLVLQSGVTRVHIIAHSMGNRALLHALHDITVQMRLGKFDKSVRFEQLVLAAPDLGVIEFEQLQSAYHALSTRTTLYTSASDRALQLSAAIHGDTRVGLESVQRSGFDVVDASGVDLSIGGHSYVAENVAVMHDISKVLKAVPIADRLQRGDVAELSAGVYALTGINQSAALLARSAHASGTIPLMADAEFAAAVAAARATPVAV